MTWYKKTLEQLSKRENYSHDTILQLMSDAYPGHNDNFYQWGLSNLLKEGSLAKNGYDEYSLPDGTEQLKYTPGYSDQAKELLDKLISKYPTLLFTIFEMRLLNEFLNHLIGQNTIFIQAERDVSAFVFRYLQESGYKNLLYKPTDKEHYLYWEKDCVIVTDLISEAPLNSKAPHEITLEKMIVDIYCDRIIKGIYNFSEYSSIFSQILEKYQFDKKRMLRYARRRNKGKEISDIMSQILLQETQC